MKSHLYQTEKCKYDVRYIGPHLNEGPLPTVLYFALSAEDSLLLDPFTQPVVSFISTPVRVFSITIPGHEYPRKKEEAISFWRETAEQGHDFLTPFFEQICAVVEELQASGCVTKLGAMGLSRGGFVALHSAARMPEINHLCLFAPMIELKKIEELKDVSPDLLDNFSLEHHLEVLTDRHIRFFIGNADTRVGTESTLMYFQSLCSAAQERGRRYPPIILNVTQSIGYKGHGTSQATFVEGATWLKNSLLRK